MNYFKLVLNIKTLNTPTMLCQTFFSQYKISLIHKTSRCSLTRCICLTSKIGSLECNYFICLLYGLKSHKLTEYNGRIFN